MCRYITYNGKSSKEFGIYIIASNNLNAPEKKILSESIPGRDGNLLIDQGFHDINIEYTIGFEAALYNPITAVNKVKLIKDWLYSPTGYCVLEDSSDPAYYRKAAVISATSIEDLIEGTVLTASIIFYCKAWRYAKKYPTYIVGEKQNVIEIFNPYEFDSLPLVRGYGQSPTIASAAFEFNYNRFNISVSSEISVEIDSELEIYQNVYSDTGGKYPIQWILNIDGLFPTLKPGRNLIYLNDESHIGTRLEIETCWRCL